MNIEISKLGSTKANSLLENYLQTMHKGICEVCETTTATFTGEGEENTCLPCWINNLQEWEVRIAGSSEYVFLDQIGVIPDAKSDIYKIGMDAFWATLKEGIKQ